MAYTTIDDPSAHHQTIIYTGNGSARSLTNDGNSDLAPDWVWIKERNNAVSHRLFDSSRGAGKRIFTNNNDAESTHTPAVTSFDSDGFSVGDGTSVNENSDTYVAWQWKANGGTTTSFTESGNNPGGTHQANTTGGFSIITYTGTGASGTIAHGLGARPKWIIIKNRDAAEGWFINGELITGNTNGSFHFNTDAEYTGGTNNMTASSVDTNNIHVISSGNVNTDGQKYVAYCFAEIQGYSKFGTYTGNGNTDGTFVYTGFKPAWLMVKKIAGNARGWVIHDNKRDIDNPTASRLDAHTNEAQQSSGHFDFLSNGFKCRSTEGATNQDTHTFVYMAFAEHPFVSSKGVPVTAR